MTSGAGPMGPGMGPGGPNGPMPPGGPMGRGPPNSMGPMGPMGPRGMCKLFSDYTNCQKNIYPYTFFVTILPLYV